MNIINKITKYSKLQCEVQLPIIKRAIIKYEVETIYCSKALQSKGKKQECVQLNIVDLTTADCEGSSSERQM